MTDDTPKQDDRIHYLYRITNTTNGKIYIGQSVDTTRRWYEHKREAAHEKPSMLISRAIKKYGDNMFKFEVIAGCRSWDDANELETLLVSQHNSLVPNGYNVSLGGYNAPKSEAWKQALEKWRTSLSPEERAEISRKQSEATQEQIATKGHPAQGTKRTPEQILNLIQARKEYPVDYTPEKRQHMSEAHLGIIDSEETKQKKADSAKEAWEKRIDYSRQCAVPGCEVSGKAKYKIIDGIRYCNKHGLRLLRYGRLDRLNPA